jgi:hypothetical protein
MVHFVTPLNIVGGRTKIYTVQGSLLESIAGVGLIMGLNKAENGERKPHSKK